MGVPYSYFYSTVQLPQIKNGFKFFSSSVFHRQKPHATDDSQQAHALLGHPALRSVGKATSPRQSDIIRLPFQERQVQVLLFCERLIYIFLLFRVQFKNFQG